MTNPKTTILGIVTVIAAVTQVVTRMLSGQSLSGEDIHVLLVALTGIGLVAARDGGA